MSGFEVSCLGSKRRAGRRGESQEGIWASPRLCQSKPTAVDFGDQPGAATCHFQTLLETKVLQSRADAVGSSRRPGFGQIGSHGLRLIGNCQEIWCGATGSSSSSTPQGSKRLSPSGFSRRGARGGGRPPHPTSGGSLRGVSHYCADSLLKAIASTQIDRC